MSGPGNLCNGANGPVPALCPRTIGVDEEPFETTFASRVLGSRVPGNFADGAAGHIGAFHDELTALADEGGSAFADETRYMADLLAGGSAAGEAAVQFRNAFGTVEQDLDVASTDHNTLYLRVDVRFTSANGRLGVDLAGANLTFFDELSPADAGGVGVRRDFLVGVERTGEGFAGTPDHLTLTGRNAVVSWVSVRNELPVVNPHDGRLYDFVVVENGVDAPEARRKADRLRFLGQAGTLVRGSDPALLGSLYDLFAVDTYAWLDAAGVPSAADAFEWGNGAPVDDGFWHSSATFDPDAFATHAVYAFPDDGSGVQLGHAAGATVRDGRPIGFFVDYGPAP